jgi:cell shape-determining protein MreC
MNDKLIINQEELQELKAQNNKLKSLVSEYFEVTISNYVGNSYLRKIELEREIIKMCKTK